MNLESMAAVIRPRRPWEAIDLGFGMVRAWWRPVFTAWFLTTFLVWLVITASLYRWPVWAALAFWWLKPLYDRVPLFVLSRALFGATPSPRETLRAWPRLWRGHLVSALTLYRFDFARSFNLPVWQLEGLRGAARWNRARILQQDTRGPAVWLTISCMLMELGTLLALYGLAGMLLPNTGFVDLFETEASSFWQVMLESLVYYLAVSLIEPFYVASGFSLYLSRRTHLEGWDVELAFRRLATRIREEERAARTAPVRSDETAAPKRAALMVALCLLWAGVAGAATASVPTEAPQAETQTLRPEAAIREILAQPELQTKKKVTRWRFKWDLPDWSWDRKEDPQQSNFTIPFLRALAYSAAVFAAIVLIVYVVRWGMRQAGGLAPSDKERLIPETLFGLDIRPESLPDDIPGTAWALWEKGEPAQALGLLYRGALASLVRRDGAPVRSSWTEGDCLAFVTQKAVPVRADYFTRLTRAWQSTAYAHRPPDRSVAEALCSTWRQHFGETA